jgi:hypothetical protein
VERSDTHRCEGGDTARFRVEKVNAGWEAFVVLDLWSGILESEDSSLFLDRRLDPARGSHRRINASLRVHPCHMPDNLTILRRSFAATARLTTRILRATRSAIGVKIAQTAK